MNDLLTKIITSLGVGFIAGLPVSWGLKMMYNSFIAPFKRKELLVKARDEGRMVVGHLVDFHFHQSSENAGQYANKVYGVYEFEVDGKKYKYKGWFSGMPSEEKLLYYKHNPQKACEEHEFGVLESGSFLIFIIAVILVSIWYFLFGNL